MMTTPIMERANTWSQIVIGAAIEVHRLKGPGLLEEIYSKCLGRECELRNIPFVKELPIHKAQLLSYLKLLNKPLGLLINFHEPILKNGIYRMMLKDADSS
jgi:hypothetical protein